jgi:hypothetical protein
MSVNKALSGTFILSYLDPVRVYCTETYSYALHRYIQAFLFPYEIQFGQRGQPFDKICELTILRYKI